MSVSLSTVLDGAENSNAAAEEELWKRFCAVHPLEAALITNHHQRNAAAIAWARGHITRKEAA